MNTIIEIDSNYEEQLKTLQKNAPIEADLKFNIVNYPTAFSRCHSYQNYKVYATAEKDRLAASGAYTMREVFINGQLQKAAYLFQFVVDPVYRKQGLGIKITQHIFDEAENLGAHVAYFLMSGGNTKVINMIKKIGCDIICDFTYTSIPVFKHQKTVLAKGMTIAALEDKDIDSVIELVNNTWRKTNFYSPLQKNYLDYLLFNFKGVSREHIFCVKKEGEILACMGILDFTAFQKLQVQTLSLSLRIKKFLLDIASHFIKLPVIPKTGDEIKQWGLSLIGYKNMAAAKLLVNYIYNLGLTEKIHSLVLLQDNVMSQKKLIGNKFHINNKIHLGVKILNKNCSLRYEDLMNQTTYCDVIDI